LLSNSFQILEFGFPSSSCASMAWHLYTILVADFAAGRPHTRLLYLTSNRLWIFVPYLWSLKYRKLPACWGKQNRGNFCKNWSYWSRSFCRPHLDFSNCLNIRRSI